jgi:hypothetical protein
MSAMPSRVLPRLRLNFMRGQAITPLNQVPQALQS